LDDDDDDDDDADADDAMRRAIPRLFRFRLVVGRTVIGRSTTLTRIGVDDDMVAIK